MPRLAEKIARLFALLSLIAALLAPAIPGFAAPAPAHPSIAHAAMGCGQSTNDTHRQAPARHMPGSMDCCVANICAMTLALPAHPSGVALAALPETATYDLRPLQQPLGVDSAPVPHPPKTAA